MLERSLSSSSLNFSFVQTAPQEEEEEDNKDNKADSGDELNLKASKYQKIGFLTDLNTIVESEAVIKYVDKVKYYNDYKVIKDLGQGSLCKVKLVEKDNVKYALKIVNKKLLLKKKKFIQDENGKMVLTTPIEGILKEIQILKKVNHRNLVKLYEIINNKKKGKLYLVLEYCEHGDLMEYNEMENKFTVNKNIFQKYLKDKENHTDIDKLYYSETQIRKFIRQIIRAINYLHRFGIIHKDIKPNNILLDKNNECKIIDFNFSAILEKHWVDNIGKKVDCNDYFRPPEICDLNNENEDVNKNYKGMPVDIWAIGVTAYILSYKKFPFYSETDDLFELYDKIYNAKYEIPSKPKRSAHFKHFLKKCFEKDPNKRITSEQILDLKWINQGEKENLKNQCNKVIKYIPTKNEIYKNIVFFSTNYNDISKLKDDERPAIKKISTKVLQKIQNAGGGKKIKIKLKLSTSKKDNKQYKEDKEDDKK